MMILGKGGHGIIYTHGKNKVVKKLPKNVVSYKEINITQKLQKIDGIIKLYDVLDDTNNYYMIMKKYQECDNYNIKTYYKQLLEIVANVHDNNIIHNDIKPQNVLSDNGDLVLIDFGSSLLADSPNNILSHATPLYCSIESLQSNMCLKSDIWSIGVMLYYDLTGKYPYDGYSMYEIFRAIQNKRANLDLIQDSNIKNLIALLLERDLNKRPTAKEALTHEYFT